MLMKKTFDNTDLDIRKRKAIVIIVVNPYGVKLVSLQYLLGKRVNSSCKNYLNKGDGHICEIAIALSGE